MIITEESPAQQDTVPLQPDTPPPEQSDAGDDDTALPPLRRRVLSNEPRATSSPSSTSSDSDSDDDDTSFDLAPRERDSDAESEDNDDDVTDAHSSNEPWPKDTWLPLRRLRAREHGVSRSNAQHSFQVECGASLSFVQRLECSRKLDHHQGCVNALHFNRSGNTKKINYTKLSTMKRPKSILRVRFNSGQKNPSGKYRKF